jgi:hypothetical protein
MMTDKNPMDPLYEDHALAGETLALQPLLFGVLPRLAAVSPEIKAALSAGFDDAANLVESNRSEVRGPGAPRARGQGSPDRRGNSLKHPQQTSEATQLSGQNELDADDRVLTSRARLVAKWSGPNGGKSSFSRIES